MKFRRSPIVDLFQGAVRWMFRTLFMLMFRIRVHGLENYPSEDGFLICANHQSFLDPIVLGVIAPRPINYLGRKSLFKFKPLGWFLRMNDTISIDRDNSGIGGLKETLRRLKRGETVMMFPEGTRSADGEMGELQSGFCVIARRIKKPLVPICFAGPFEALPRTGYFPLPKRIHVVVGEPIPFGDLCDLSDDALVELLDQKMRHCFDEAKSRRSMSGMSGTLSS